MLRVGTCGWQYRHWQGGLYPRGLPTARWLEHYAAHFPTVEVDSTFYRLPRAETCAGWASRVPAGFCFALKASRYLTHLRRLRDPEEPVARLLAVVGALGPKLGPVLLQLPPDLPIALDRLDAALGSFPARVRVAVEPRHPTWFVGETASLLEAHGAALCLTDRGSRPATPIWRTTDWVYVRFHGGRARSATAPGYGRTALATWLTRLTERFGPAIDGYAYFNNDAGGAAVRDADHLTRLARRRGLELAPVAGGTARPTPGR